MVIKSPRKAIVVGLVLVLSGFIFPVLMVAGVIHTTLWLSILSHGASVSGLLLGLLGVAMVSHLEKERDSHREAWWE
ncbi:MAG: hypothetical protein ACP5HM_02525 [Anaerolineae bacterium]